MMEVRVKSLCGIGSIPRDRSAATAWFKRNAIEIHRHWGNGGEFEAVKVSDLPPVVRQAWEARQIESSGLQAGQYDAAAHQAFDAATPSMRATALRKAEIARFLVKGRTLDDRALPLRLVAAAQAKFGPKGTDQQTLRRILKDVAGVDPINFAPALLPDYSRVGAPAADISDEAWSFFMTTIREAGPQFPLKQAWRDVRDVARTRGWAWPSYETILERWNALTEAQRLTARFGTDNAAKALSMPIQRDKTTILPLEIASLDGRMLDFWVDFGDGKAVRPIMLTLVDVASNFVLGYELVRSENAVATARLIRTACRTHGIFDRLYTDNGSAFSGHLVAGGSGFKWRGKGNATPSVKPLGVCYHLGIEITFAIPKNAQAKIAERTFAALSRVIDDRPEFAGAHAGHAPGATADKTVTPVTIELATDVLRREVDRHNLEDGRRGQGAKGRSYAKVFQDGIKKRAVAKPTAEQLYYAGLIYTPASVDRWGRVQVHTWTYGDSASQDALLRWHGKGQILVGRDPDNFEAPAVAFDDSGRLICREIMPAQAGVYGSVDGAREAAKNRKAARAAVKQAEEANAYLDDATFRAALAQLGAPTFAEPPPPAKVVGARFGGPLQPKRQASPQEAKDEDEAAPLQRVKSFITEEHRRNLDRAAQGRTA